MPHTDDLTLDLFSEGVREASPTEISGWPDARRFPLNVGGSRVDSVVLADLQAAAAPLIVSGYASLERIVRFLAALPHERPVRILVGHEPVEGRRGAWHARTRRSFSDEVRDYWTHERRIAIDASAALVDAIERLRAGTVQARHLPGERRLHAKIYCTEQAVTLGSSNFTESGLAHQIEANVRFEAGRDPKRFAEARGIAENLWAMGTDYTAELIALLESLLQPVGWAEALARACAELLEGTWIQSLDLPATGLDGQRLWPSQRQGIAQALTVLSRQDSVLVADATGSGKTRMGVHLIAAVLHRILRAGRIRRGLSVLVCPPAVVEGWRSEALAVGLPLRVHSHGTLSHTRSQRHEDTVEAIRGAEIVCVDEGHNFLNLKSNRTQHLLHNMADHMILFTATPINRSAADLLRIADMLGADNLEPSTLRAFRRMLGARRLSCALTEDELARLREEIRRFTVRRTKAALNRLIEREPAAYRNRQGEPCRFPRHRPRLYPLGEPEADRRLAAEIRALADRLHAVTHFVRPLELPEVLRAQGVDEARYLEGRLRSAKKLARYVIMASLRSSRAALAEHLAGTQAAVEAFGLEGFAKSTETGDVLATLERIAGHPPRSHLSIVLPDWLADPEAHRAACAHDARIYRQILDRVRRMSPAREAAKAAHLAGLLDRHDLVLAFDSRPITLADLRTRLQDRCPDCRVLTATGEAQSERHALLEAFRLGSGARRVIGLCSDSLSEGVNLQQASALVHLDMPSVVRIAEQRVGRVDRMDSPHAEIEAWWPDDAPEFALSSDERFIERFETVESLLGSNMPLPEGWIETESRPVDTAALVREMEQAIEADDWSGVQDAFAPVRRLVEGEGALIPPEVYAAACRNESGATTTVAVVRARRPWAFFALRTGPYAAPAWILYPAPGAPPVTDFAKVAEALRKRLAGSPEPAELDTAAAHLLHGFSQRLQRAERQMLSRRKQRALEEMEAVLEGFAHRLAAERGSLKRIEAYSALLRALRTQDAETSLDWDEIAVRWLELIRPVWYRRLSETRRTRPLVLRDIRDTLLAMEPELGPRVLEHFRELPATEPLSARITVCILGTPDVEHGGSP